MDTGGLAQMNYNNASFMPSSFGAPTAGFGARGGRNNNMKRLSVAMPPKSTSPVSTDNGATSPLPRATSRSHLLAGLRTAPKSPGLPTSQTYHQLPSAPAAFAYQPNFASSYAQSGQAALPRSATLANLSQDQYALYAAQQGYASPDHVLAPPSIYGQQDEVDPSVLEQLQLTGQFLAQRQQQLQMQLANITAAANQLNGLNGFQPQVFVNQQQMQQLEPAGQQLVYDSATGQYQYVSAAQQQFLQQRARSPMAQSASMHNLSASSSAFEPSVPTFRAEISPPPMEKQSNNTSRSDTPITAAEHVQPLPPPSANAFRRGHSKKVSSMSSAQNEGSKAAGGLTRNASVHAFGPGGARAGIHPVRQPRGPPAIEELIALPTANHEGSKNFAARRRRQALNNLVRAGSIRREASGSPATSPTSETGLSLHSEADEPGMYRKQSPIGSEVKQSSRSSGENSGSTSSNEKNNSFDMGHFVKQLPPHMRQPLQAQVNQRKMLGATALAEKRRSFNY